MHKTPSPQRIKIFKAISITLGIAFSLFIAEAAYRLYCYYTRQDINAIVKGNLPSVVSPEKDVKLGQVIQLSRFPKVVYEFIPNSSYRFVSVAVQTNSNGFRDADFTSKKPANAKRIIGLGDSVMFGWGVNQDENYLSLLEAGLNRDDSILIEVINTGVPGYNTVMEVEALERKFDLTQVDYVIINFVGNDLDLPNFIQKRPNYLTLEKSFILMRFEAKNETKPADERLRDAPFNDEHQAFEHDLERVPDEYRDMVGREAFNNAMQRLKELSQAHGFGVLVLSTDPEAPAPDFVRNFCLNNGFQLLEVNAYWKRYLLENPFASWKLSDHDAHPNTTGHKVIAAGLFDFFKVNPI